MSRRNPQGRASNATNTMTLLLRLPFIVLALVTSVVTTPGAAQVWTDMNESEAYVPRHEASFVQAGDKFYLFGGREQARRIDVYDYATNAWTSLTGSPSQAPLEFNHFQATEYQGLIWVIGAFRTNNFPNEAPAESIYVFDPANRRWMEGPEIPAGRRRGGGGLAVHDDKFYVVAGNQQGHSGGYIAWFDEYDPYTGEWTVLDDAPRARDHFHAAVVGDKLYAAGGRQTGGPGGTFAPLIPEVDVFDFASGTWSTLPPASNLPTPRAGTATAVFNGKIMVIGGEGNGLAYNTVEGLDPNTGQWQTLASLNHRRHGTQAIVSGAGVYVAAGSPNQGGGNQRNMEVYNANAPAGEPSVSSVLSAPQQAVVFSGAPRAISLAHAVGNVGAFITDVSLTGENAADFLVITPGSGDPFLIPVGGARDILLEYIGTAPLSSAMLNVNYNGQQTAIVEITGSLFSADFDRDGDVDAADYDVWRAQFGLIVADYSGADANGNGVVDAADYVVWRNNFGAGGNAASTAAPEPAAATLTLIAAIVVACKHRVSNKLRVNVRKA
jgi:hypothetical protein